jgi:hypothetical protein
MHEYLGLESGLPMFRQDFTCPALLKDNVSSTCTGLSPAKAGLSIPFHFIKHCHWPGPRSLAATDGVSVDVLSCRYLDVSVPCVRFLHPIFSGADTLSRYLETCFVDPSRHRSRFVRAHAPFALAGWRCAGAPNDWRRALALAKLRFESKNRQNRFSRYLRWVPPFGDPWIKAYSQLPTAFRSVSRPSSPVHAKASTNCPYFT